MKRGFIPLVVIAIIGLVSVLTAGGSYAVYKYNEVAKEKEVIEAQLNEQNDLEIKRLQEKVVELQDTTGTTTEEVDESIEKQIQPVVSNPDATPVEISKVATSKQEIEVETSMETEINVLNILISNFDGVSSYVKEFSNNIDYYIDSAKKSRSASKAALRTNDDPDLDDALEWLVETYDYIIELSEMTKNRCDIPGTICNSNNAIESNITDLEKIRNNFQTLTATQEIHTKNMEALVGATETNKKNIDTILNYSHEVSVSYLDAIKGRMEEISSMGKAIDKYIDSSTGDYIVQPYISPFGPLTMPKTTYCTMRGTGVNGSYDISCN